MELLGAIFGLVIIFLIVDQYLFEKFSFSLRDAVGLDWYLYPSSRYTRAMTLFYNFPTQEKVDVLIKYGLLAEGAKLIPVTIGAEGNTVIISKNSENHAILNVKSNTLTLVPDTGKQNQVEYRLISEDLSYDKIVRRFTWKSQYEIGYYWWKHFEETSKSHSEGVKMCRELMRLRKE